MHDIPQTYRGEDIISRPKETNYRWHILILATLTSTLTVAIPAMCLPVLFDEIARELGLSLVQIGMVWGIGALPGMLMGLVGGAISDRWGARSTLRIALLLVGPVGALRGLANDLVTLAATILLYNLVTPLIMLSFIKICSGLFSRRQLGLANGVMTMGAPLGFMVTSMISATLLSPWLGGWRNVLFFYGAIALIIGIAWLWVRPAPNDVVVSRGDADGMSLRKTMTRVARIRNVWLLGFVLLGVGGCVEGTLGYLPLYLRGVGWSGAAADGALSAFHAASMLCVLPFALWSDRLGMRIQVLMGTALMIIAGVGLLSVADGLWVWGAVIIAGLVRDGFMAVLTTTVIETEGVGTAYAGTAIGLVMLLAGLGRMIAPALGNSLADISPSLPFVFWTCLAVCGFLGLVLVREKPVLVAA